MPSRSQRRATEDPDEDELQYPSNMGPRRNEFYGGPPMAFTHGGNEAREQPPLVSHEHLDEDMAVEHLDRLVTKLGAKAVALRVIEQKLELLDQEAEQGEIGGLSEAMGEVAVQLETQHEAIREEARNFPIQVRTLMDSTTDAFFIFLSMILPKIWEHQQNILKKQRELSLEENQLSEWELRADSTRNRLLSPSHADDLERRMFEQIKAVIEAYQNVQTTIRVLQSMQDDLAERSSTQTASAAAPGHKEQLEDFEGQYRQLRRNLQQQFTEIAAMYRGRSVTNSRAELARLREEMNVRLEGMSSMGHDHRYRDQPDSHSTHHSASRAGLVDGLQDLTIHDEDYGLGLESMELPITQWGRDWDIPRQV